MSVLVLAAFAASLLAGCDRATQPPPRRVRPAPAASPLRGPAAYITVSDSNPPAGAIVVVAGNVESPGGVGAFRARLAFDSAALAFVDEFPLGGMMRAVNARPGQILVAGASAAPATDPRLFALRLRALRPNALAGLSFHVDELTDGGFADRTHALTSAPPGTVRLDRSLLTPRRVDGR